MKYVVRHTSAFKRDYKLMLRRHMPVEQLHAIVTKLANGEPFRLQTATTLSATIGPITANAILRPTGCSSTRFMRTFSSLN